MNRLRVICSPVEVEKKNICSITILWRFRIEKSGYISWPLFALGQSTGCHQSNRKLYTLKCTVHLTTCFSLSQTKKERVRNYTNIQCNLALWTFRIDIFTVIFVVCLHEVKCFCSRPESLTSCHPNVGSQPQREIVW